MEFQKKTVDELLNNEESLDGFAKHIGLIFKEIKPWEARAELKLNENVRNPLGGVHGGVLFSMADIVSGVAANAAGVQVTTLDSNIQFLAPALFGKSEILTAYAKCIKHGKNVVVMSVDITDNNEKLISTSTFTFFVLK